MRWTEEELEQFLSGVQELLDKIPPLTPPSRAK